MDKYLALSLGGGCLVLLPGLMLRLLLEVIPEVHQACVVPEPPLLDPNVQSRELDLVFGWGRTRGRLGLVRRRQGVGRLPVG